MSNYQPRDNSGALFKNDKGGNESRPDYRGDLMVNGEAFEVAAWIKTGNKGKFMSLAIKPKEEAKKPAAAKPTSKPSSDFDDVDDDFPF